MNTAIQRLSTRAFALLAAAVLADARALAQGIAPCKKQAYALRVSCKSEAHADLWEARARCENIASPAARAACLTAALDEYEDSLELCDEQWDERREKCEELGIGYYNPNLDPQDFAPVIDNPYLPMIPGTTYSYEKITPDGVERTEIVVTYRTKEILGIACTVVHDVVSLDGALVEDTFDWFAQDLDGNVWYLGESVNDYDETGRVVDTDGSWEAGVNGAEAGIVMPGAPAVGDLYRQEYWLNDAEDIFEIESLNASVSVPYGAFANCLMSEDTSPIEPDAEELKFYAPGIGRVLEINANTGSRNELVSIDYP